MFADDLILKISDAWLRATNGRLVELYRHSNGRRPSIAYPVRYSDQMIWRKTVDFNPEFVVFSDKLACKDHVRRICPDLPQAATLWAGTDARQIPDELLRRDVFIKANHGSTFNHRTYGEPCDRSALEKMTSGWLNTLYGEGSGEWPYFYVDRKIFVEELIGRKGTELLDFGIRASNGRVILGYVIGKAKTPEQWHFYLDPEGKSTWSFTDVEGGGFNPIRPELNILEPYMRAVEYAQRLSQGMDFARYDFFWDGETLYGGEITLFPAGGVLDPLHPHIAAVVLDGWDLRQSHFLKTRQTGLKRIYAGALRRRLERDRIARENIHCP